MPALSSKAPTLLASVSCSCVSAASTLLFTVPQGKTLRISYLIVRNPNVSLSGATSFNVTNFVNPFSLTTLTSTTSYLYVLPVTLTQYAQSLAGVAINFACTTGVAASTATVELYGTLI